MSSKTVANNCLTQLLLPNRHHDMHRRAEEKNFMRLVIFHVEFPDNEFFDHIRTDQLLICEAASNGRWRNLEEVMDYGTYCCAIAALLQKPIRDFPFKQGREQSPEIDIPSW